MDINEFIKLKLAQEPESSGGADVWTQGRILARRREELASHGKSGDCKTLDEVIKAEGLQRSKGRLILRVYDTLDQKQYGHLSLSRLRYLLQLSSEAERRKFVEAWDVETLPIRQLKTLVQEWNSGLPLDDDVAYPMMDQKNPEEKPALSGDAVPHDPPLDPLVEMLRWYVSLGQQIVELLEGRVEKPVRKQTDRKEAIQNSKPGGIKAPQVDPGPGEPI